VANHRRESSPGLPLIPNSSVVVAQSGSWDALCGEDRLHENHEADEAKGGRLREIHADYRWGGRDGLVFFLNVWGEI